MSDLGQAIVLMRRTGHDALTVDQLLLLHQTGQLRPPPGVRVVIVGSVPGYTDEVATFHEVLAHELVRRGVASYV
jgi:hypothetical protein